jgi:hypothetical protein
MKCFEKVVPTHIHTIIDWAVVKRAESLKFLCIHITEYLTWSTHNCTVVKHGSASSPSEGLTGCVTAWYGKCTIFNHKALQRMVQTMDENFLKINQVQNQE